MSYRQHLFNEKKLLVGSKLEYSTCDLTFSRGCGNTTRSVLDNRSSKEMENDHMTVVSNPRFKYRGATRECSHVNYMAFKYFFVRFNYLVY